MATARERVNKLWVACCSVDTAVWRVEDIVQFNAATAVLRHPLALFSEYEHIKACTGRAPHVLYATVTYVPARGLKANPIPDSAPYWTIACAVSRKHRNRSAGVGNSDIRWKPNVRTPACDSALRLRQAYKNESLHVKRTGCNRPRF